MNRRQMPTLLLILLLGQFLNTPRLAAQETKKPNIVLIMADDLGYGDVGYHGGAAKTPNLDKLAETGVKLERHYVNPMCSPTRAALMTGRYASRYGCTGAQNEQVLPFGTATIATALRSLGYATALVGKWHLGSLPEQGPNHFGFDFSYGSLAGGVGPYSHRYKMGPFTQTWHRNEKLIEEQGHVTDLITGEAVCFIQENKGRPFFLYVPFTAVHVPITEPKEYLEANAHVKDEAARLHAACVTHLDASIGRIVAALDKAGIRDDTLVIFLSDNGAHNGVNNGDPRYPGDYLAVRVGGSNGRLRGFKSSLYAGGIQTPALVSWPGRLKRRTINDPLHATDWMPTLCKLAGYSPKTDLKWDGQDIFPILTGQAKPQPRTLYTLGVGRKSTAVIHGDWKLLEQQGKTPELYNLAHDPAEATNLAERFPDRVAELRRLREQLAARDDDARVKREKK